MTGKKGNNDKKIGKVGGTQATRDVEQTESVKGIGGVAPTSGVGRVTGAGPIGKNRATRIMTLAEREQLLQMIDEEADKLFEGTGMSSAKKKVIAQAVKMAIDAGLVPNEEAGKKGKK